MGAINGAGRDEGARPQRDDYAQVGVSYWMLDPVTALQVAVEGGTGVLSDGVDLAPDLDEAVRVVGVHDRERDAPFVAEVAEFLTDRRVRETDVVSVVRPLSRSRTRDDNFGGTSTTRSPAATSC